MTYRERMDQVEKMLLERCHTYEHISKTCIIPVQRVVDLAEALNVCSIKSRLTKADGIKIKQMVEQGFNDHEIGKVIGAHHNTVYRYRKANGIKTGDMHVLANIVEYKRNNLNATKLSIAAVFGVNRGTVTKALKQAG